MHQHTPDLKKAQYVKKSQQIAELREKISRANASVLIEYRGMTVKETTDLRNRLRPIKGELNVAKNTLLKRALAEVNSTGLDEYLEGPTAVVFAYADSVAAVKAVSDFTRDNRFLILKGGSVDGRVYGADQLRDIARMPPREQIYSQLLGALQGPAASLVGMLQAPMAQLVFTLQAAAEKGQA
ncbi:MAG: 50S ribosomal protein L10 [Chloroflexi bacterium]|nr:50S ribosomal protein L10 [Chloroflexota bacterium]